MTETVAPVWALASLTDAKIGTSKIFSPAFFGFTPATKQFLPLAYSMHFSVWNWPVLPVIPWVMILVSLLIRIDMFCSSLHGRDDLGRGFRHGVGGNDRQAGFGKNLLAEVFVGALHAHHQRHGQMRFL